MDLSSGRSIESGGLYDALVSVLCSRMIESTYLLHQSPLHDLESVSLRRAEKFFRSLRTGIPFLSIYVRIVAYREETIAIHRVSLIKLQGLDRILAQTTIIAPR